MQDPSGELLHLAPKWIRKAYLHSVSNSYHFNLHYVRNCNSSLHLLQVISRGVDAKQSVRLQHICESPSTFSSGIPLEKTTKKLLSSSDFVSKVLKRFGQEDME
uniref:Uncharacterized protein n=2 Tax=Aplanochytrium stocchinoi TaxID=215587 RepID=A0A7S3LPR2_9STRA|mmetsp:Transcript_16725/g.20636  ORF Transcript_16725/g.20636 Transcript_16725/m.20636 type:complete len:104 (+) Transcript_16725:74-385(+)